MKKSCLPLKAAIFALLTALAIVSARAQQTADPSFLKVGGNYWVKIAEEGIPYRVQVLASGGGGWFRVNAVSLSNRSPEQPEPEPTEMWLNFAHVVKVIEWKAAAQR